MYIYIIYIYVYRDLYLHPHLRLYLDIYIISIWLNLFGSEKSSAGASWSWPLKTWTLPWLQLWRGFASNYQAFSDGAVGMELLLI
jgi:hypothetical protein